MQARTILDAGHGAPTLVFVHGYCCHATDWQWHIDAFSKGQRVVAPTLRGHEMGDPVRDELTIEDQAEDVAKLLKNLDIDDAVLCGHSLGMRVVLETHAIMPERVKACVLIDGSNTVDGNLEAVLAAFDGIEDIQVWAQGLFDEMFLPNTHLKQQAVFRQRIAAMPPNVLTQLYRNMIKWDGIRLADRLEKVAQKPLLVLQSTTRVGSGPRRCLRPNERSAFLNMLDCAHSNCRIVTYTDANHFINLDKPEQMKQDILSWLAENA